MRQSRWTLSAIFIILRPNRRACVILNRLDSFQAGRSCVDGKVILPVLQGGDW